jgi:hypothetical protein
MAEQQIYKFAHYMGCHSVDCHCAKCRSSVEVTKIVSTNFEGKNDETFFTILEI